MTPQHLRDIQAPLKEKYRNEPNSALATLVARGLINVDSLCCELVRDAHASSTPGLHPMAGGDGSFACAAEMLLEAVIGCAGVTFAAVCTAMEIPIEKAELFAEGDMDFRGTLGVDRATPVGMTDVRLRFEIASTANDEKLTKAVQLSERYCVVAQTLKTISATWQRIEV